MTFLCSIADIFVFCVFWTSVHMQSISHRIYDQPPSIVAEPVSSYCSKPYCDVGDIVTIYYKDLETIRIRCIASGRPEISYKWTKDGTEFDTGSSRISLEPGIGTLVITNATESDRGIYQCYASNTKGTALSKKAKVEFAINEAFKTVTQTERRFVYEGLSLSLKCEQPHVVPKPTVYWTHVGKNVEDPLQARVQVNKRVAIDYEGTLHFANIEKDDVLKDHKFVCNMHNYIYRTYSEGEDKIVNVSTSPSGKSVNPVSLIWSSTSDVQGLKGEQAKFMCIFAGKQTPDIKWKRIIGGKARPVEELGDDRIKVTKDQYGHELVIENLDYKDRGEYQCSATNDITTDPVTNTFTLRVEARPYWVNQPPSDLTKGVEEDAEFECMVEGMPKPEVEWFINTKPLADVPNPRRTLQKHTLKFKNITDSDSQVIQCKATNKHGSLMADFYLNALALAPEITKGPGEVKVAEENSVDLICENNGKPDPKLRWKKGTQPLNSDRYIITNRALTIKNVSITDIGAYTCIAKNRYGQDRSSGNLIVRKKTTVSLKPAQRKLKYGGKATFSCFVTSDAYELPNLKTSWFKNGEPIDLADNRFKIEADMLTIVNISSKDSANYTCHADNEVDSAEGVSQLKVEARPEPPTNLMLKTCGDLKATLIWKPGFDNYLPITNFIIYSKTFYDEKYIKEAETSGVNNEVILKLSPYANYTFKVSAVNQLGESDQSKHTIICETKAAPPKNNPTGVKIIEDQTGKLVIEWDEIKPKDQNGPDFRYMIYTTRTADDQRKVYEIREYKDTKKVINTDSIYEEYQVEVKAVNRKGEAEGPSYKYTGHSGMGVPTVVPGNFEVDPDVPFSHKSIGFRWDPVDTSDKAMQGKFLGYKIRYWNIDEPEKIKELEIIMNENSRRRRQADNKVRATVRLPPFSSLQLDVVVRNTYFDSNGSNVINVTTPEGVPSKVVELSAKQKGGKFMILQWKVPLEANGIITGYETEYQKIIEGSTTVDGMLLDKNTIPVPSEPDWIPEIQIFSLRVTGLELSTQYRFYVWARTSTGRGDVDYVDAKTAAASKPSIPFIQEAIPGKTFVNVTWKINKNDTAGFEYFLEYRKYGNHEYVKGEEREQRNNWLVLNNLTSAQTYEVRVVAQSGEYISRGPPRTVTTTGTLAVASAVYEATWFIIMMVVLALLLLILIIVCLVKRSRGDKYHVQEKEKLRGLDNDERKTAQYNGFNDNGETQPLAGSPDDYDKGPSESDKDSLEEYGDPDPSRFNEDGSFIGQYGAEKMTASEVAAPSAMHTFV